MDGWLIGYKFKRFNKLREVSILILNGWLVNHEMRRSIINGLSKKANKLSAILLYADVRDIQQAIDKSLHKYNVRQLCIMLNVDTALFAEHSVFDFCLELESVMGDRISTLMDNDVIISYINGKVAVETLADILGVSIRTVKNKIDELK